MLELSKVYDIILKRYREQKIIVCDNFFCFVLKRLKLSLKSHYLWATLSDSGWNLWGYPVRQRLILVGYPVRQRLILHQAVTKTRLKTFIQPINILNDGMSWNTKWDWIETVRLRVTLCAYLSSYFIFKNNWTVDTKLHSLVLHCKLYRINKTCTNLIKKNS